MFDFFRKGAPSPRQIERAVKKLTEPHGEQGPRFEAAERLAQCGTPESLFGLLKRFTISSRVITQDIEEKQMVIDMLLAAGDAAIDPILKFIRVHHQVDWPVQALAEAVGVEPANGLPRRWFSRPVPSTTQPRFHTVSGA